MYLTFIYVRLNEIVRYERQDSILLVLSGLVDVCKKRLEHAMFRLSQVTAVLSTYSVQQLSQMSCLLAQRVSGVYMHSLFIADSSRPYRLAETMRAAFFWVTQRVVVIISFRGFGRTYRFRLQASRIKKGS